MNGVKLIYKILYVRLHLKNVVFAVHLPCFQNLPALLIFFFTRDKFGKKKDFPTYLPWFFLTFTVYSCLSKYFFCQIPVVNFFLFLEFWKIKIFSYLPTLFSWESPCTANKNILKCSLNNKKIKIHWFQLYMIG